MISLYKTRFKKIILFFFVSISIVLTKLQQQQIMQEIAIGKWF